MKSFLTIAAGFLVLSATLVAPQKELPAPRVRLEPKFIPGQTLRYQLDVRSTTETRSEGPIENPQAPSQLEVTLSAVVRLDVLGVESSPPPAPGKGPAKAPLGSRVHLRTTYEKCAAATRSDVYEPQAAAMEEQYKRLEGKSIEFYIEPDGRVTEITGGKDVLPDDRAAATTHDWLTQLARGVRQPQEGVVPGQKWTGDLPIANAPLAGLAWRTETTYLRDEPCQPAEPAEHSRSAETCAVLLTRFEMVQPAAPADPTPPDYRQRGLRTSGKLTGSGESLSYISLRTGHLVSATQSLAEEMDLTVTTADGDSRVHYAGRVTSRSHVTLLREPSP